MKTVSRFYLAASYSTRADAYQLLTQIEKEADGLWECSSRWAKEDFTGAHPAKCARIDLADIRSSQAFIMNLAPRVSPGKYTELGYALAQKLPILLIGTENRSVANSVFFSLTQWVKWAPSKADAPYIASWLTGCQS